MYIVVSKFNKNYLQFLLFFLLLISGVFLIPQKVCSQKSSDIGFFAGVASYQGDINPYLPFYSPGFALGPIYRYSFHPRTSVRASGIYHFLKGNDLDFSNVIQQNRAVSFHSNYIDLSATWEFNFLPYRSSFRKTKYSPYVFAGLGYHILLTSDIPATNHLTVPFGLGIKANIYKRLSGGVECSFRKTFTDNIDGISNFSTDDNYRLFGNKDWYTFAGIFFTFKIFNYKEDCPAYD